MLNGSGEPPGDGRTRLRRRFAIIGLSVILAALTVVGTAAWIDRRDTLATYTRAADNLGIALAEQLARSTEVVDLALQATAAMMATQDAADEGGRILDALLSQRRENLPQIAALAVVDADGTLVAMSGSVWHPGSDLSDRDFYRFLATHDDAGLFIEPPMRSPVTGAWTVVLARRVNGPDGRVLGFALGAVALDYFATFRDVVAHQKGAAVTMVRRDGIVLASYPEDQINYGSRMPALSPWYARVADGGGSYETPGYLNGIPQLVTVHPLRGYPLVLDVSITEDAALAAWRTRFLVISLGAAAAIAGLLMLLALVIRQFCRLEDSGRSLAVQNADIERQAGALRMTAQALGESERKLSEKSALLELTLERMDQGIMMVEPDRTVSLCNRRAMTMLDLPPEVMARRPGFAEVLGILWRGDAISGTIEDWISPGGILDQPQVYERRRPNGRVIEVRNAPFASGGVVRTYTDITDRVRAQEQLRFAAHHDALTGLANRALYQHRLTRELQAATAGGRGLAVLFLDLDRFKLVNDTRGHEVGDKLLCEVAARIRADLRDGDLVARFGGDEFAVLQMVDQLPAVEALASRLVERLGQPFDIDGQSSAIGVSIGIARFPQDGTTADVLMRNADTAMYRAKESGRSTWRFFEPAMEVRQQERVALERDLRTAIKHRQLYVVYQPICDAATGEIVAFEALLRWRHPTRGAISPAQFIPLAEELGLIVPLGMWVAEQACAEAVRWARAPGGRVLRVGINFSPLQFRQPDLSSEITAVLARTGCAPSQLVIEVTEGLLIDDETTVRDTMHRLKDQGVRFVLDDFGTGHAGLSALRRYPFDQIKIDKSFVQNMAADAGARAIVHAILTLSEQLDVGVIAEGVETEAQLAMLREFGCRRVQGYLTGRPMAAAQALETVCQTTPPPGAADAGTNVPLLSHVAAV